MTNPARDLAATGTPGPWRQEPDTAAGRVWITVRSSAWPGDFAPIFESRTSKEYATREADANKAVRAVNALPAIADLLDALAADDTSASEWWKRTKAARDAVAAALTGETP